ncbi:MAG: M48 family metalloprotease [Desulfobacterota bacterium]|nr:M48 family metalloprotease [Thermodesulfobacteriota bacterium]
MGGRNMKGMTGPVAWLVLLCFIVSCAVNPVTGKKELMLLSERDELQLGRETDREILQQYGLYEDPKLTSYVQEMAKRIGGFSHRPHLNYDCKILDAPVVNAFAVPGGYVYFTRGILAFLNSEAELAGVMGHEIGHIAARHSAQQYSKAQIAQLGLGLGSVLIDSPLVTGLAQIGVGLLFLRFSRDNEREADELGVEYAARAGYDAEALAQFFETLEKLNPGSDRSGLPGWFSTHPSPENRIAAVRAKAKEWFQKLNLQTSRVEREGYLKRIDGLLYGEDPRQGYVAEDVFYHPVHRFEFPTPSRWKLNQRPSQVQFVSEGGEALLLFLVSTASSSWEAERQFLAKTQPIVLRSETLRVNGLPARRLLSDHRSQNDLLRVLSYFIEKDRKAFAFHGVTLAQRFPSYVRVFETTMGQFKELTDPRRIEVKPDRVRVQAVKTSGTLEGCLTQLGVPKERMQEAILLNGGRAGQTLAAGSLVKVVERGR